MAKWLGSLHNTIFNTAKAEKTPKPEVGQGCTIIYWTDREAATVVEVINEKRITIQRDKAIRADKNGMSDSQSYTYERDTKAPVEVVTLRKDGKWHLGTTKQGLVVVMGARNHYHDYSF